MIFFVAAAYLVMRCEATEFAVSTNNHSSDEVRLAEMRSDDVR